MITDIKYYLGTVGLTGLCCAVKGKALNSSVLLNVHRNEVEFPFALRIPSSDVPTYKQIFLDRGYDFLVNKPPEVIVDAGANIGLASVYFANKYPKAKIIAIEPEKCNFHLLQQNVGLYPNIIPIQAALWNKNEQINLVDPGLGNWGFMTVKQDSPENLSADICHSVTAITIDKIIDDFSLNKIDILKIDIEGAEREVFSDASNWIHKVDSVIIELHERMKPGCNRSFYNATSGFTQEWYKGETIYLSRGNCLTKCAPSK